MGPDIGDTHFLSHEADRFQDAPASVETRRLDGLPAARIGFVHDAISLAHDIQG